MVPTAGPAGRGSGWRHWNVHPLRRKACAVLSAAAVRSHRQGWWLVPQSGQQELSLWRYVRALLLYRGGCTVLDVNDQQLLWQYVDRHGNAVDWDSITSRWLEKMSPRHEDRTERMGEIELTLHSVREKRVNSRTESTSQGRNCLIERFSVEYSVKKYA